MIRGEWKPVQLLPRTWFLISQPLFLTSWYYSFYRRKRRREGRARETCPAGSEDCWTCCCFFCFLLEMLPTKNKTHWAVGTMKEMKSGGRWTPLPCLESPRSNIWLSSLSNSQDWVPPIFIILSQILCTTPKLFTLVQQASSKESWGSWKPSYSQYW